MGTATPGRDLVQQWRRAEALLGRLPGSRELRAFGGGGRRTLKIRCDRSLPFEFVDEFLPPFLSLWDADRATTLSAYDPGLGGAQGGSADLDAHLLWLDWRLYQQRLSPEDAAAWIGKLARAAGSGHGAPVLVNGWAAATPGSWAARLNQSLRATLAQPGLALIDLDGIGAEVPDLLDERNDQVGHYPFSQKGTIAIARHIASDLLPVLLGHRIRGVILDLDDTLYGGVLAENGAQGVQLTAGHRALQERLASLRSQGLMLALCSRNERADVEALFRSRSDFPLRWQDFAAARIDWSPKSANVAAIARELNVDAATLLFVDDNQAELIQAGSAIDGLQTLHASPDPTRTEAMLRHYPGLNGGGTAEAAAVRTADVRANRAREALRAQVSDTRSYLSQLGMVVELHENDRRHLSRVHELSEKTNQFNLALARLSGPAVERAFDPGHLAVTIRVQDALSDSGIVGALVASIEGELATVEEFVLSCRALGRDVETLAARHACRRLAALGVTRVRFRVAEGPRNLPAREWLARFLPGSATAPIDELLARLEAACREHPARLVERPA